MKFNTPTNRDNCCLKDAPLKIGDHVKWHISTSVGRGQIRAIDDLTAMIRTGTGYDCVALSWLRPDERAEVPA